MEIESALPLDKGTPGGAVEDLSSSESSRDGLFKATRQWKQLLLCILNQSNNNQLGNSSSSACDQVQEFRFNGKQLLAAVIEFLRLVRPDDLDVAKSRQQKAAEVCQKLLDSRVVRATAVGFAQSGKFESKSSRWYQLDLSSPCILPFVDFLISASNGTAAASPPKHDSTTVDKDQSPNRESAGDQSHRQPPHTTTRRRWLLRRLLAGGGGLLRDGPARLSCRLYRARSASCLVARGLELEIDDRGTEEPRLGAEYAGEKDETGATARDCADSANRGRELDEDDDFDERCPGQVSSADQSISAVEVSVREEIPNSAASFPETPSGQQAVASLDYYIHQLCLQRLLKLVDLPILDEILVTPTDKLGDERGQNRLVHLENNAAHFYTLGNQHRRRSNCQHQQQRQHQELPQQSREPPRVDAEFQDFLASQVAHDLGASRRHRLLPGHLPALLSRQTDPLGWAKLRRVFSTLLAAPEQDSNSRSGRDASACRVLQVAFSLLSLRHRRLSENLLAFLRRGCAFVGSANSTSVLGEIAEILLADSRPCCPQDLQHLQRWRPRTHCLFRQMVDRCDVLFRIPADIYERARLLRTRRCRPELLDAAVSHCLRVSPEEDARLTRESTEVALRQLVERMLADPGLSVQERRARLSQLRRCHPEVYYKYFSAA